MEIRRETRLVTWLMVCLFAVSSGLACGSDDGELDNSNKEETDNQETNNEETNNQESELEKCLDACPDACPAPEERLCASDGERYCNECVIDCHGLEIEQDESQCGSAAPELIAPGELSTDQGTALSFTVDGYAGSGGGDLTIEVVDGPAHGTITPEEGLAPLELTYTPEGDFVGEDTVELMGTDGGGANSEVLSLTITVNAVNSAPEISSIPDQVVAPSGTTGPLEFTVSDAETAADDLIVSAESLHPDILPQDQIVLGGSGEVRTIEVSAGEEFGTATVEVTVSDGELSTSTDFEVTLTDFCPLMTYDCAVGCCPAESHVVSQQRGSSAYLDVDDSGNVYMTFSLPSGSAWGTGLTVYTAATGEWEFFSYNSGNARSSISVAPTGRVHHTYARHSASVYYQYSDDQGQSWTPLDGIPGSLMIGGTCTMGVDSDDDPHLLCGMDGSYQTQGIPRYIEWDGSQWNSSLADFDGSGRRHTVMHLGYADRPHVIHTYGPTDANLHYSRKTDQWITEAVPITDGYRASSPDRIPGFVLAESDEVHVAFSVRPDSSAEFQVWYGVRTIDATTGEAEWSFEVAISNDDMAENTAANISLDLDDDGNPVVFSDVGTGAFRDSAGDWHIIQTDREVSDVAVHNGRAYIVFPVDGTTYNAQRIHLSVVDLVP